MDTETYRSGHNGADSKSVREQSPASSNLAVSAKKSTHRETPYGLILFFILFDMLKPLGNDRAHMAVRKGIKYGLAVASALHQFVLL